MGMAERETKKNKYYKSLDEMNTAELRKKAHGLFDPIWRCGILDRQSAYKKLAKEMEIREIDCHFSKMNRKELYRAIKILENKCWSMEEDERNCKKAKNKISNISSEIRDKNAYRPLNIWDWVFELQIKNFNAEHIIEILISDLDNIKGIIRYPKNTPEIHKLFNGISKENQNKILERIIKGEVNKKEYFERGDLVTDGRFIGFVYETYSNRFLLAIKTTRHGDKIIGSFEYSGFLKIGELLLSEERDIR